MSARTPTARTGPDPKVIIGVVVGVLVLAAIAVFATAGGGDDEDVASVDPDAPLEYGIVTPGGQPLPALPDSGEDPAVGMTAPSVVSERSGEQARLEPAEDDRPTMIVFLAHWCPHCQRELPLLTEMAADGAFDDIRTVAVLTSTTPERDNYPPSAWLDREGWTGDRLYDDEESTVASGYGLSGLPFIVFLDADGEVVQRLSGEQPESAIRAAVAATTT